MLKDNLKITHLALAMSLLNFLFFHFPFYSFVFHNIDYKSLNSIILIISLMILMLVLNAFVFYLLLIQSHPMCFQDYPYQKLR